MESTFTNTFLFSFVILPILIFLSRITDQTLNTIRIIFVSKGMKYISTVLGFFETFLWLVIIKQIFENLDNYLYYVAYAGGFGMGNYVGIIVEEKMAKGLALVRVIPLKDSSTLVKYLREANFRFTTIQGHGAEGPVNIIFSIIKRKEIGMFSDIVKKFDPKAFFTIEEVKFVSSDVSAAQFYHQDVPGIKKLYKSFIKQR